ncbi:hypothetical protein [Desulfofalx alkaliphila]|uniref:hypothetical protein n=1 Tax=Desulfofalx alkaliphila TaxID=105483 RepID=UPI0004E1A70D|nr:hypothetical protein [Desulfofalx alkaliphila]
MPIEELKRPERIDEDKIERLKELFPESFTEGKFNLEVFRELISSVNNEILEDSREEYYGLQWVGKKDARKLAFSPPTGTLKICEGQGENEDQTKNFFIEGDNLEVLRILQKSYSGRIKTIYIDIILQKLIQFNYPKSYCA